MANIKTETESEGVASNSEEMKHPDVTPKAEVPREISKSPALTDVKRQVKVEQDAVAEKGKSNLTTFITRGKRKSTVDVDKDEVVNKKARDENVSKFGEAVPFKDKLLANDVPVKKMSHHRRELPEVEMMNYMLPGDRNKAEVFSLIFSFMTFSFLRVLCSWFFFFFFGILFLFVFVTYRLGKSGK